MMLIKIMIYCIFFNIYIYIVDIVFCLIEICRITDNLNKRLFLILTYFYACNYFHIIENGG